MKQHIDMLHGDIKPTLIKISFPIILSNFIQTALGMFDMIWVGRLGSGAVSAVGTASFYVNLATAISTIITIGTGVRVAQMLGKGDKESARVYNKNGLLVGVILGFLFSLVVGIFSPQLLAYFGIIDTSILTMAKEYLVVSLLGIPLMFLISVYTTIYTSYGDTKTTFKANAIGLVINLILDPVFIFGLGIMPALGVVGAAWTNNIARVITLVLLIVYSNEEIKQSLHARFNFKRTLEVFKLGLPITAQRVLFSYISMAMAKIIVQFGAEAIAVQKIGIQIESISYVTVGGLQGAISAFVGQNFGAGKLSRIKDGYRQSLQLVLIFGIAVSALFIIFPKQIFSVFIAEPEIINDGVGYMRAIGLSQVFMCIELLTVGAFNGIGKTYIPPIISVIFTIMRIPLALLLSQSMGLMGVWWSISLTSVFKGVSLFLWFNYTMSEKRGTQNVAV